MNFRQVKIAFTIDLLNQNDAQSPLSFAKEKMDFYEAEVGKFQRVQEVNKSFLGENISFRSLALQYEYATLNLDVVEDDRENKEFLQNFTLMENK